MGKNALKRTAKIQVGYLDFERFFLEIIITSFQSVIWIQTVQLATFVKKEGVYRNQVLINPIKIPY